MWNIGFMLAPDGRIHAQAEHARELGFAACGAGRVDYFGVRNAERTVQGPGDKVPVVLSREFRAVR